MSLPNSMLVLIGQSGRQDVFSLLSLTRPVISGSTHHSLTAYPGLWEQAASEVPKAPAPITAMLATA